MTLNRIPHQFIIDEIPSDNVREFCSFMDSFRNKTSCRWLYKKGKSIKCPQLIVPQSSGVEVTQ